MMAPRLFVCVSLVFTISTVWTFILDQPSCKGRCHKFNSTGSCKCNDLCTKYHDCCLDFQTVCGSCAGQCGAFYDPKRGCQCNDRCSHYGNCCNDYTKVCVQGANSPKIADELWRIDVNRFTSSEITLDYGLPTTLGNLTDKSLTLFTTVDEHRFSHPLYKTFIALFNPMYGNYQAQISSFLDEVMISEVTRTAHAYLTQNNLTSGALSDYRQTLHNLWFLPHPVNSSTSNATSGFESYTLGNWTGTSFTGSHNWVRFYLKEKAGHLHYQGYVNKTDFLVEAVVSDNNGAFETNFFVGSSPAFEINLLTICALGQTSGTCPYTISGTSFAVHVKTSGTSITQASLSL